MIQTIVHLILLLAASITAFQPSLQLQRRRSGCCRLEATTAAVKEDSAIQWELLKKHHARGSWKGIWTTYDYIGDVSLETVASVDCLLSSSSSSSDIFDETQKIDVTHTIVVGAKRSDCATCFDSMETKTIPVCAYTPDNLQARKTRLGACGMVVGPSLLRSGASKSLVGVKESMQQVVVRGIK
jgi:hypothetical protein